MRPFPRLLTFVAGAAAGVAFLAYCGGDPNANATTPDAGSSTTCDCPAPKEPLVVEAQCDKIRVAQVPPSTTLTSYFADVAVPSYDPERAQRVTVMVCDQECFSNSDTAACDSGVDCEGASCGGWQPPPSSRCVPAAGFLPTAGRIVVVCGQKRENSNPSSVDGKRYQKVIVRVD